MKRNVGLDLLKIIAMLMIVFIHILGKGRFISEDFNSELYQIAYIFENFFIIAVNCYVLITGYFQVDSDFKFKKIVNIWIKVIFYSISIYIIILLLGQAKFSILECIKSFFPILTKVYWFVNCYILLYLLSPFINKSIKQLEKKDYEKLLIILIFVFCILTSILPSHYTLDTTGGYGIIWFIILYLVGAYIKKYIKCNYRNKINLYVYFAISVITYIAYIGLNYTLKVLNLDYNVSRLLNYNFITVFLASIFLFLYFKNLKIKSLKVINTICKIAPLTFAVYLIHEQTVLRNILYLDLLNLKRFWNKPIQFVVIPITALAIFLLCIIIEKITQQTIQKWIYNFLNHCYTKIKETKCYQKIKQGLLKKVSDN